MIALFFKHRFKKKLSGFYYNFVVMKLSSLLVLCVSCSLCRMTKRSSKRHPLVPLYSSFTSECHVFIIIILFTFLESLGSHSFSFTRSRLIYAHECTSRPSATLNVCFVILLSFLKWS